MTTASSPVCRAHRAMFHGISGIALCDAARQVSFAEDATGQWQTLSNADAPALILGARLDLEQAQQMIDLRYGSLVALVMAKNDHGPRRVA